MKVRQKYEMPQLDVIYLQATDIITASTDAFEGEWVSLGGNDDPNPVY